MDPAGADGAGGPPATSSSCWWSATQFYADFGALAADVLEKRRLTRKDFDAAAETMTRVILDGCCTPSCARSNQDMPPLHRLRSGER